MVEGPATVVLVPERADSAISAAPRRLPDIDDHQAREIPDPTQTNANEPTSVVRDVILLQPVGGPAFQPAREPLLSRLPPVETAPAFEQPSREKNSPGSLDDASHQEQTEWDTEVAESESATSNESTTPQVPTFRVPVLEGPRAAEEPVALVARTPDGPPRRLPPTEATLEQSVPALTADVFQAPTSFDVPQQTLPPEATADIEQQEGGESAGVDVHGEPPSPTTVPAPSEEADSLAQIAREPWEEPADDRAGADEAGADASPRDTWRPIAVPMAGAQAMPPVSVAPRRDDTCSVVSRRVYTLSAKAENLAARGAYFAARAEMVKALRAITQALDAGRGATSHSEALARAMRAFQEAEDFAPRGSQLEADINLAQTISGHRTPVLKDVQVDHMTPLVAQQRYLEYAQEQFALACDDLPAASYALYALARVYTLMEQAQQDAQTLCLPKAMTLHQAALLVDARNAKAANELGVLLARFGQLEDARRVLNHALTLRPEPRIWRNLAVVHRRLGDAELARRADEEGISLARRISVPEESDGALPVQWVDPGTFSHVRSALEP